MGSASVKPVAGGPQNTPTWLEVAGANRMCLLVISGRPSGCAWSLEGCVQHPGIPLWYYPIPSPRLPTDFGIGKGSRNRSSVYIEGPLYVERGTTATSKTPDYHISSNIQLYKPPFYVSLQEILANILYILCHPSADCFLNLLQKLAVPFQTRVFWKHRSLFCRGLLCWISSLPWCPKCEV